MLPTAANDTPAVSAAPTPAPAELPELLTVPELAKLLRLHPKSVYELLPAGEIPGSRRIGRAWRVHRDTVVAWVAAGQGNASPSKKAGRR